MEYPYFLVRDFTTINLVIVSPLVLHRSRSQVSIRTSPTQLVANHRMPAFGFLSFSAT
jgi:hypothetical protein